MEKPFQFDFEAEDINVLYSCLRKAPMAIETTEPVIMKLQSQYRTQVEAREAAGLPATEKPNRKARRKKAAAARKDKANGADQEVTA